MNVTLTASTDPDAHGPGCPAWCTATADPDPFHPGEFTAVSLSLAEDPGAVLLTRLEQGYTALVTYVAIVHKDRYDLDLTLDEAEQLAGALAELVRQGRTQAPRSAA
jgi:hypothetical protein